MMTLYYFLSTAINSIPDSQKKEMYEYVDRTVRQEYEDIQPEDNIVVMSNFDEPPAPPTVLNPKLHHLETALSKMKNCDGFFLLAENDGSIKPGCMVEMNAWISAGLEQPIIRRKNKEWK